MRGGPPLTSPKIKIPQQQLRSQLTRASSGIDKEVPARAGSRADEGVGTGGDPPHPPLTFLVGEISCTFQVVPRVIQVATRVIREAAIDILAKAVGGVAKGAGNGGDPLPPSPTLAVPSHLLPSQQPARASTRDGLGVPAVKFADVYAEGPRFRGRGCRGARTDKRKGGGRVLSQVGGGLAIGGYRGVSRTKGRGGT